MPKPTLLRHPSLESATTTVGTPATPQRQSLFDTKDDFIVRIAPVGVAAIYFGSFSLAPQDIPLSRQALFKLSFLYRQYLQPAGLRIVVNRQVATLTGTLPTKPLSTLAEILALQIEGIRNVQNETQVASETSAELAKETVHYLLATDQTLRAGVQVTIINGVVTLIGEVGTLVQKNWAENLAEAAVGDVNSQLKVTDAAAVQPMPEPPVIDDESQQALVLFRLRLVRETEHLPLRVKANRGVLAIQGKVRTEALRQRAEGIARSTLGLREVRSSISIAS